MPLNTLLVFCMGRILANAPDTGTHRLMYPSGVDRRERKDFMRRERAHPARGSAMTELALGPLLRHVGPSDATVWVEAGAPCEVEVLVGDTAHRSRTFHVSDHHYALVRLEDIEPGSSYEYSVHLDREK